MERLKHINETLKRCPHCGGIALLRAVNRIMWAVRCDRCGAQPYTSTSPQRVADKWNRRKRWWE